MITSHETNSVNSSILDSETRQNQEHTTQMNRNQEASWKSPGSRSQQAYRLSIRAILKETTPHILMLTFWNIGSQIGMTFHFHGLLSNEETQQHFHFPKLKKKNLILWKGKGFWAFQCIGAAVRQILHTSSFFWKYEQNMSTFLTKIRVKYEQKYE